jgi:hypothetical protein
LRWCSLKTDPHGALRADERKQLGRKIDPVGEFAGRRITGPREGDDEQCDTAARRLYGSNFQRFDGTQLTVLTIEDYDDEIGDARHGRVV